MLCDYHIHTHRCGDAQGNYEEYIENALKVGLTEIGFSGHCPQYFLPKEERTRHCAIPDEELEIYVEEVESLKTKYKDSIIIKTGLEVDYIPGKEKEALSVVDFYNWDYLLLSVHFLDDWAFVHPKYIHYYENRDINEIYRSYYKTLMQGIETGCYNIVAHFDLPKKFRYQPTETIVEEDQAIQLCKKFDMVVEVNTAGYRKPIGEAYPSEKILRKCFQAQVPLCLGSDAHRPYEVGKEFESALDLIKKVGYTHLTQFNKKRKTYYPIGKE